MASETAPITSQPVHRSGPAVKPTIGRIVHYVPKMGSVEAANYAKVIPAIITAVASDEVVNLKVFTDSNADTWRPSTHFSEEDKPDTWHWPRY